MIRVLILIVLMVWSVGFTQTTVAVYDLEGTEISQSDRSGLSNRLRSELFKTGKFIVVERSQMDQILKEQGIQLSGCTSSECAVEVGQILNVQKVVVGTIEKVGSSLVTDLRLVDVGSGKVEQVASNDCLNCSVDDLLAHSRELAANLAGIIEDDSFKNRLKNAAHALKRQNRTPRIKEFRIAPGFQGYFESALFETPPDSFMLENNYLYSSSDLDSIITYDFSDKKSLPFATLDIGMVTHKNWYFGLYGQFFYAGAMVVLGKEFGLNPHMSLYGGVCGGVLADFRSPVDHIQMGGPEIRFSVGNDRLRFVTKSILWFDLVQTYSNNPVKVEEGLWMDVERDVFGISPSVTAQLQFAIPRGISQTKQVEKK